VIGAAIEVKGSLVLRSQVTLNRSSNYVNEWGVEGVLGDGYTQGVL
jgi:hypothetical protein